MGVMWSFLVSWHCMVLTKQKDRNWMGFCFAVLLVLGPEGAHCHHPRVFSLSLGVVFVQALFFSVSWTAPAANEPCNIHLVQRCCFGAADCQALLLIVPASHAEARGSERRRKAEYVSNYVVNLSSKPSSVTFAMMPWERNYSLRLWALAHKTQPLSWSTPSSGSVKHTLVCKIIW